MEYELDVGPVVCDTMDMGLDIQLDRTENGRLGQDVLVECEKSMLLY